MQRKSLFLLAPILSLFTITAFSITSEQLWSHAENVQIIFDPIFGHNHNGTNSAKLATNSVNTTQLVDNSVTNSKISGPISVSKGGTGLSSLGSANQVLRVNSGGTALEYATQSSGNGQNGDMVSLLSTTIGDYNTPATSKSSTNTTGIFLSDDYSTNSGWTQVGTGVTINDASFPGIMKANGVDMTTHNRVYKSSVSALSDDNWEVKFDFIVNSLSTYRSTVLIAFTAGTSNMATTTNQDNILIYINDSGGTKTLVIRTKDGTTLGTDSSASSSLTIGTRYYATLTRTTPTEVILKIYTDPGRTTQLGSTLTATVASSVAGLTHVQHGSWQAGNAGETTTYEVDNLVTSNDSNFFAIDGNITSSWKSNKENKPWLRLDLGSNKDLAQLALNVDRTNTNATTLKIYSSTDTTFTSGEVIAYVNVSDFTDDVWRFILNNRLPENRRYVLIEAQENSCVLAINEIKYREITDWSRHSHTKRDVTTTNSFLDSN